MTIKIFQNEINDGIADLVKSTASVAYCSEAIVQKDIPEEVIAKAIAENQDQIDLYYIESVLVSTGWNKNDDVFTSEATWAARNTPEDKQFNFMHNENDIIGHITGSYVLTKDGKAVADDTSKPEEFDIITQAVLYNSWTGEENRDRMGKIIAEIQEGKWYVSMECLFSGFDYALINEKGEAKVLARDEESSFLTKHLRAYGGAGEYEGYKLGRALANISFSGKGLVSKPANPRSVILSGNSTAQINVDSNSKLSIGELNMSDVLTTQVSELKAELEAAKAENQAIKAKIEEAKDKEFASKVEAFEAAADESKATIEQLNETIKSTQARVAELEDTLQSSQTELAEAMKEMDEMKKKEKSMKRKASLAEAGLEEDEVEETLASFDALDDDAFENIVAMMKKKVGMKKYAGKHDKEEKPEAMDHGDKKKKKKEDEAEAGMPPALKEALEKKKKEKEAKAEEEAEISEDAFEDVETSEATLVESAEVTDEIERSRASVSDWFANNIFNK
tara:strand:+ start:9431 stop:10951 length:1521 start_codon:yes stop_codon:yes gene_type:complete